MAERTTGDMFLTAREKSANNYELAKKMIDSIDSILGKSHKKVRRINENWNLHSGQWPEMEDYIRDDVEVLKDVDGDGDSMNLNDFIVHHPKINNITNYILGDIITQPLIPIVKDFSSYGRKHREQEQLGKLQQHYYQNFYAPRENLIRTQVFEERGVTDPLALTPDEQKQLQSDLQARIKAQIPRSVLDDLKKIKTPDEKIRQVLLDYDIKAHHIEELFTLGGEQAVVAYEEYYRVGRNGVKPTIEQLNSKWVSWGASEGVDYCEDGDMARYEQYLTPHAFIMKHGRSVINQPGFMRDVQKYFTEVPGYYRDGAGGKNRETQTFIENERDFVDAIGENPDIIQNNWRTNAGQQEIWGLYAALNSHRKSGFGIRECYVVFKWTETVKYVQRRDKNNKIEEFFFTADYMRDKSRDIVYKKFPINRVYHGYKIADKFYVGIEAVPWQYYGGVIDFQPKLTILGRKYSTSNGNDEDNTLIGPAIQYQFRYNVSASKLEDLEKKDIGKIVFWNQDIRPEGWNPSEYTEMQMKVGNVPFTDKQLGQRNKNSQPVIVADVSNSSKMEEYRKSMEHWEREMYAAMRVNKDAIGEANQYQSNALTQSNIQGSAKQLLPFHNKRRLVKQRVLNAFSNISMLCFLEDPEKQEMLLDDFSRMHLQVNAYDIKANATSIFVVDDYGEAQNVERIKGQVLPLLQKPGTSVKDVIEFINSKTVPEMLDHATISEIKTKEVELENHQRRMAEIDAQGKYAMDVAKYNKDRDDLIEKRRNEVDLMIGEMQSMDKENAADVNEDKIADSLVEKKIDVASKEKMNRENNETKLRVAREKASKSTV